MDDPCAIRFAAEEPTVAQLSQCRRHGRALRPDDPPEHLMSEGQGHGDAVRGNPPPAVGELPEQQNEAHVEPRVIEDRQVAGKPT